jgi:micrococcal nuclease
MITRKPVALISALIFLTLFFSLYTAPAFSKDIFGKVIKVADGDTITVLDTNKRKHKIRFYGIDSPEGGQAFGDKAKKATSELVYGKNVEVNVLDQDRYGRQVGIVFYNNTNINGELIKKGYAWVYTTYCKVRTCDDWYGSQVEASLNKRGLWADPKAIPPWEYRSQKRQQKAQIESNGSTQQGKTFIYTKSATYKTPSASRQSSTYKSPKTSSSGSYHGNVRSHVFHAPGYQHFNCKNCTKPFNSITEAMQAGYRAHKQCVK